MDTVMLVAGAGALWVAQAAGVTWLMGRRGFHPLPWLAVSSLLGPAMWPLALLDALSGPPGPHLVRRGRPGPGVLDVLVAFKDNHVPDETATEAARLLPYGRRLVLARVVRAEGPAHVAADAQRFLIDAARQLGASNAELTILHGDFDAVLEDVQEARTFNVLLRSDYPDELFDGDGSRQDVRCLRHVTAA